jgi:glycogen operon protein
MLTAGDEMGRTQQGNNNAYCLDDETSWVDWSLLSKEPGLLALTQVLIALRHAHPVLRRRAFFVGQTVNPEAGVKDVGWFTPLGDEMTDADWGDGGLRTLGMFLDGDQIPSRGPRGERISDASFLLLLHAGDEAIDFIVPGPPWATSYDVVVDTAADADDPLATQSIPAGERLALAPRSGVVLRATR